MINAPFILECITLKLKGLVLRFKLFYVGKVGVLVYRQKRLGSETKRLDNSLL